jgi:predicted GIY-YIG superfamily endonuclease
MSVIYILKLKGGKYYVGRTSNIDNRLEDHSSGNGSAWTKIYEVEDILDTIVQNIDFTELAITLQYMRKYGIDNVRGASYNTVELSDCQRKEIETHIRGEYDLCFLCGSDTHFASYCNKRVSLCERVRKWLSCLWKRRVTLDYALISEGGNIISFGKYKGYTYREVLDTDKGYCNWVKNTHSENEEFNKFKSWLN